MEIVTVRNLSFTYPLRGEKALTDISFSVESGDYLAVCGGTGSGKSTLLYMLKKELTPRGDLAGEILFEGKRLAEIGDKDSACKIGYVMQRPEQQLVTDKVWHELSFGLENINVPSNVIHRKVAEMASYFGIEGWFEMPVDSLSGGQKQLLNLAAVMVMNPKVLILDEPTAQLDPVAAVDFLETVARLNRDMGITVILVEHRLEHVLPQCNKLLVLEDGRAVAFGKTRSVISSLEKNEQVLAGMPAAVRLYNSFHFTDECPISTGEGSLWIRKHFSNRDPRPKEKVKRSFAGPALELKDLWFKYGRKEHDVLRGTALTVYEGEIFCILGGNGSGKSTALSCAAGLLKPYHGEVRIFGKNISEYKNMLWGRELSMLPQDVQTVFLKNTVKEELEDSGACESLSVYDLKPLLDSHPYDLSGGQQQLLALTKAIASRPRLLLLDEPTKGVDTYTKERLIGLLKQYRDEGMTLVIVTHDAEFAAQIADRCALFFRGAVTSVDAPEAFFSENNFYTTAVNRMTRDYFDGCVTLDDVKEVCEKNHD